VTKAKSEWKSVNLAKQFEFQNPNLGKNSNLNWGRKKFQNYF